MQGRRPEIRKACIKNRLCIGDCTENHFQESVNTVLHCIEKWKCLLLIGKTKIHKQQLERLPLSLGLRSFKIDRSKVENFFFDQPKFEILFGTHEHTR